MLSADAGGGGGTDWQSMSMIDMWLTVGNQDTTEHWNMLTGWRKSYELTLQHLSAVKNYRENLVAAWPPEKSAAAQAYVARLDELIANLEHTYDAAVANHSAFSSATLALSASRRDLEAIVDEYQTNEGKIASYEEEKAQQTQSVAGKGGAVFPVKSPVASGRQAELLAQARKLMSGLSSELVTARSQLRQPQPYKSNIIDGSRIDDGGDAYEAPPVPPITPFYPDGATGSGSIGAGTTSTSPGGQSSTATASPNTGQGRVPGLVLGGTQPPVVAPPAPSPINPPIAGGTPHPITPTTIPPIGSGRSTSPRAGAARPGQGGGFGTPSTTPRGIPQGGVIGARPLTGGGQTPVGRPATNVNPVGGVISPNGPSKSGPTGRPPATPIGAMGSRPGDQDDDPQSTKRWDPDNPWATAKGVDPVVLPPEEAPIDPGPAIGLS